MRALLLSEYKKLSVVEMPRPGDRRGRSAGPREGVRDLRQRHPRLRRLDRPAHPAAGHGARGGGRHRAGRASVSRRFTAGDRVTFDSTVSCGACDFCRRGQINLCDNRMVLGVSCGDYRRHGAFAEYVSRAGAHPVHAARQPAVRARRADRGGVDRGACGEPACAGSRATRSSSSAPA